MNISLKLLSILLMFVSNIFFNTNNIDKITATKKINHLSAKPIINQVQLEKPVGNLKIPLVPFVYNSLYNIKNLNNPVESIKILKQFNYLVCSEPGSLIDDELQVTNGIKDTVKLFGYVNIGGTPLTSLDTVKSKIDNIKSNNWYGVFIDQFGYDFGETRERQNEIVNYAHRKNLKCFVNCWFIDDAFSNKYDKQHNPKKLTTKLTKDDLYLMESFYVSNGGYSNDINSLLEKCIKAQQYRSQSQVKVITLSYKNNAIDWQTSSKDIENSYFMSLLMGFDGWWFTDYLESDNFDFGLPSDLNIGNKLLKPLTKTTDNIYLCQTDKYYFTYQMNNYPNLNLEAYNLKRTK